MDALFSAAAMSIGGSMWSNMTMPSMPGYTTVPQGQVTIPATSGSSSTSMSSFSSDINSILGGLTGTMPQIPSNMSSDLTSQANQVLGSEANFDQDLTQLFQNYQQPDASPTWTSPAMFMNSPVGLGWSYDPTGQSSQSGQGGGSGQSQYSPVQPPNPFYSAQMSGSMFGFYGGLGNAFSAFSAL